MNIENRPDYYCHEDLCPYVEKFHADMDYYGVNPVNDDLYTVDYVSNGSYEPKTQKTLGTCVTHQWHEIWIKDKKDWPLSFKDEEGALKPCHMRKIMYHELGHCVSDLRHDETEGAVMYAYQSSDCTLTVTHWDEMVRHMFLGGDLNIPLELLGNLRYEDGYQR
jgi:hypothetical protein